MLVEGERVEAAFRLLRDFFVFTDRRLILVDRQGMTGKKTAYHSIPYRSIERFSVETAGHLDLDAELRIRVRGLATPIQREWRGDASIYEMQRVLARCVT